MNRLFFYHPTSCGKESLELLTALSEFYPIKPDKGDTEVIVQIEPSLQSKYQLRCANSVFTLIAGTKAAAARGVGAILAGATEDETDESEFKTFAILLDSCRNFVFNTTYLRKYFAAIALLGCNMAMLYTKDTYVLPGEPYFGYLRGSYTIDELKELDDYADKLGIELIGSIQSLGHLEPVLRWPAYAKIADTSSVLLTTEKDSYRLIEKMLDFFHAAFRSQRIHLGMDETHDLGRGRYMDLNGYKSGFDIYNEHLAKIVPLCEKRNYTPIIWSDMFFRMGSKNLDYYDQESVIPPEVAAAIPPQVELAYWDYYHTGEEFYSEWIQRHRALGFTPIMTSGIWTWRTLWYDHATTCKTVEPCIAACRKQNVKEIIFALWGDDGGFCDWGSALAGIANVAGKIYQGSKIPVQNRFFSACEKSDYNLHILLGQMGEQEGDLPIYAPGILWDDPLLQIYIKEQYFAHGAEYWPHVMELYEKLRALLPPASPEISDAPPPLSGDLNHARILLNCLIEKLKLIQNINGAAHCTKKRSELLHSNDFGTLCNHFSELENSYRRHWHTRGKSQGFEVMQIRLAGQRARIAEAERRLRELDAGICKSIPEIDETAGNGGIIHQYKFLCTGSFFI